MPGPAYACGVGEDLDDTVVVPRRPAVALSAADLDDTVLIDRSGAPATSVVTGFTPINNSPAESDSPQLSPPMFYSFKIGLRSTPIALNAPCYVGRRPSPPRISMGQPLKLLRVPSPTREVSATHLEVKQLGTSVVVTDLRSTNGSIVMVPGSVPRKLRQGESLVVTPGTLVDIGDENILQILPMERLV